MRMRNLVTGLFLGASSLVIHSERAAGQEAPPPPPTVGPATPPPAAAAGPQPAPAARMRPHEAMGIAFVTIVPDPPFPDKEIAGLSDQAPAERLTWDRVYTMALVRARTGGTTLAEALDPRALAEQARRHAVADFARFRKEFLSGRPEGGGAYHDPAAAYMAILSRIQAVDDARVHSTKFENLRKLVAEIVQGQSAGLSQFDVDLVNDACARARRRMSREVAGYRDALDELKPALGLSPHAAVFPDRRGLSKFGDVFQEVQDWIRRPDRDLADLPRTIERLPDPGEAVVGGRPILRAIEQDPARLEEVLRDAALRAITIRSASDRPRAPGDGNLAIELRVRRRIRRLLELRGEFEQAKRAYELGVRMTDQAFERFTNSRAAAAGSSRSLTLHDVIEYTERVWEARDRLAATWTSFRAERLALYRDLGVLPYDNWDAFYADLSAPGRPEPQKAPAAAPGGPEPAVEEFVPPSPRPTAPAPASPVARPSRP